MARVGIGIPVFNGAEYIAETLDSILCQDYTDFEVVISDNASTDATQEICESYARRDPRIRYSRLSENVGAARNYNRVFGLASGEFFKWAAHDDLLAPRFLSACVAAFDAGPPEAVLVHPHTTVINEVGQTIRGPGDDPDRTTDLDLSTRLERMLAKPDDFQSILHRCFPVFGLFRRSALQKTSLIANFPRSDMLVLVELALLGPVIALDEQLFIHRRHLKNSIMSAEKKGGGTDLERLIAHWFDPRRGKFFPATVTRLSVGFLSAALRLPNSLRGRISATRIVLFWIWKRKRQIAGEIKIVLKERLIGPAPGYSPQ
jgi:glycosyltransferase involved in cell wall biosynthesis